MSYWQESTFHIRFADLKPLAFLVFIKNRRFYIHYIFSKTISLTCFNNFNKTDREKTNEEILTWQRHKVLYWKCMSSISRYIYIIKFPINLMYQARIQHLKEVSQVDEIAVFPFVSNSDVFDLSHVSLSELRCQHPRYASDFMLLLIDQ